MKKTAVFFDRDGTINEEIGYITNVHDLRLIDGSAQAIKKLNEQDILTILVTNQTGPARGYYNEAHVIKLNNRVQELLNASGAKLDRIYYCPHLQEGTVKEYSIDCNCRKPKTGMVDKALQDYPEIDISYSYVVGDKASDVELAINTGSKGILLKTGYGERVLKHQYQNLIVTPAYIAHNIVDAVEWILADLHISG